MPSCRRDLGPGRLVFQHQTSHCCAASWQAWNGFVSMVSEDPVTNEHQDSPTAEAHHTTRDAMPVHREQRVRNHTLRAVRLAMRLSQAEFASAIRRAGTALGEPNTCNKRLVQKWEAGEHATCRPNYQRALQAVTRISYNRLGFSGAPVPRTPAVGAPRLRLVSGGPVPELITTAGPGTLLHHARSELSRADSDSAEIVVIAVARVPSIRELLAQLVTAHGGIGPDV